MQYEYILIRYGELTTKGKNRKEFIRTLRDNTRAALKPYPAVKLRAERDRMYVDLNGQTPEPIVEALKCVFGIHTFSLVVKTETTLESIKDGALALFRANMDGVRTFKIQAHRSYKHFALDTYGIQREVGAHVLVNTEDITVDVHNPDLTLRVEVRADASYVSCGTIQGAGGLPVASSGKGMLLLSGGIDSPVAAYMIMKRGVYLEAIHFHSPPYTNERAKQKVLDLATHLTKYCKHLHLHLVPFTDLQKAIHEHVPGNYTMTIMRRMMLRIAERVAENRGALVLATGESLGQVASQTLDSMYTINEVTNMPVIRPLVATDKVEILEMARNIGTYETSILPYEDCCTLFLPKDPATKPKREKAAKFETWDWQPYVDACVEGIETVKLSQSKRSELDEAMSDLF
ncbi:MAG: tRNA uracil 4-sulfurtransferase ThiI [Bacilli bacterium]